MPDEGSMLTDKAVAQVERRIRKIYKEAEQDIARKMADFTAKHAAKDAQMQAKLRAGEITKEEYQRWQRGQVFIGKQWEAKKESIADTLHHANERAQAIVNEQARDVFATNFNYQNFELEKTAGIDMGFGLYDSATVGRLIKERPQLLPQPKPGKYKDNRWNNRVISNSITQSIIQGEGIPEAAKRLAQATGETNMRAMRTHARTALTGAQNAGRIEAMHEQEDMGIEVKKKWIATLDDRTRDTHGELDGQTVGIDEPFTVDGMEIMFPGDESAPPELVYNCRCRLGYIYPKYDKLVNHDRMAKVVDEDGKVHYENVGNVTFKEWQEGKRGETAVAKQKEPHEESKTGATIESPALKMAKETTLQIYDEAAGWADENFKDNLDDLREAWANVPSQVEAIDAFEKEIPQYTQIVSSAVEKYDFSTRTDVDSVCNILEDGRFKSQIETGKTHGHKDIDLRKRASDQLFAYGEHLDIPDDSYEIYGFLGNASGARMYGNCRIVFKKDQIIDRTTLTLGDSLQLNVAGADPFASMASSPKISSYGNRLFSSSVPNAPDVLGNVRRDMEAIRATGEMSSGDYIELQFHGGVTVDDIEYIEVSKGADNADKLKKIADRLGVVIKWLR